MAERFVEIDDTNNNVRQQLGVVPIKAGTGRGTFQPEGQLNLQATTVGTGADTTEDTLHTFTLPKNSLSANGKGVRVKFSGNTGANGNNKTLKFYFGTKAYTLANAIAANAKAWSFTATVHRSAAGAQVVTIQGDFNGAYVQSVVDPTGCTQDETADIVIKTTGTNGTGTANDLTENLFSVEVMN